MINLCFILLLSIFLGMELIKKVPSILHSPLLSGMNAISGIILVGAIIVTGSSQDFISTVIGTVAITLSTINVVGGYLAADRMLTLFDRKNNRNKK